MDELVPKNKFDTGVIDHLKKLSFEELKPIIPKLLEWLQDMNWPVASLVSDILTPYADQITPELISILKTKDGMWKYWILINFGRISTDPIFLREVGRIANFPTSDEIEDEVNLIAIAIINDDY